MPYLVIKLFHVRPSLILKTVHTIWNSIIDFEPKTACSYSLGFNLIYSKDIPLKTFDQSFKVFRKPPCLILLVYSPSLSKWDQQEINCVEMLKQSKQI